jgi:hypothetical protein
MEDAIFLDIRTGSDVNGANIPPQDGPGSNITSGLDDDLTDQHRLGVDKGPGINQRPFTFKFIKGHKETPLSP